MPSGLCMPAGPTKPGCRQLLHDARIAELSVMSQAKRWKAAAISRHAWSSANSQLCRCPFTTQSRHLTDDESLVAANDPAAVMLMLQLE